MLRVGDLVCVKSILKDIVLSYDWDELMNAAVGKFAFVDEVIDSSYSYPDSPFQWQTHCKLKFINGAIRNPKLKHHENEVTDLFEPFIDNDDEDDDFYESNNITLDYWDYPDIALEKVDDKTTYKDGEDVIVSNDISDINSYLHRKFLKYDDEHQLFVVQSIDQTTMEKYKYCLKYNKNKHLLVKI